jgi:hypothetical protein
MSVDAIITADITAAATISFSIKLGGLPVVDVGRARERLWLE